MRRLTTLSLLALAAAVLPGCSSHDGPLVAALGEASAPTLVAPSLDGDGPRSWTLEEDGDLLLRYRKGYGPVLTLRKAPVGDLCTHRGPDWDRCTAIDDDAVRLSFEEMDAVVVRRDGSELTWGNITFELPDEDYASDEELQAAIRERVDSYVDAARDAPALTAPELVDEVPRGSVERAG